MSLAPLIMGLFGVVDRVIESKDARETVKLKLMELHANGDLKQMEVNAKEAEHQSVFVAGWRPFVGWVCAVAFGWMFVLQPILVFVLAALGAGVDIAALDVFDMEAMLTVLGGLLGMGALRTYERKTGVARANLNTGNPGPINQSAWKPPSSQG